ncbi:nucleoside/nucleotide kinase family protein [Loktanella sp. M215]|uniref:nucleoside/nucleotide kinase family protein n=1 Tax=Loktanella sp. M215 TaxID=2675431 RepID=UPI001F2E6E50|nr:nucleoside/nucleotide kinase family protein [Loktanella sp. M215]
MQNITDQVNLLAERIHEMRETQERILVGIAGAPGSGKSTLASELARRLNVQRCPAMIVPMDGFHLDNAVLDARGLRGRKGAPETFDADGFLHLVRRMTEAVEVVAPVFDRSRDLSVAGAVVVPANCAVIIVEGNYLMFDEMPWANLADLWDLSVRVEVGLPELRARLIQRWLSLNLSRTAAMRRAEGNDIPNAERVIMRALPCDITLRPQD